MISKRQTTFLLYGFAGIPNQKILYLSLQTKINIIEKLMIEKKTY
jgi:hypothetical protein